MTELPLDARLDAVDELALERWLSNKETCVGPLDLTVIAGGRSNLTYRVTAADGSTWVLRRPPLGDVLESAHDVQREYRRMRQLADTEVPVPRPVGYEQRSDVTDTDFFVTDFVQGLTLRTIRDADALSVAARRRASDNFLDVLVDLHDVPVEGDRSRGDSYVARQLRVWQRQMLQQPVRDIPAFEEASRRLEAAVPQQRHATIIHGDYRLDNVLLGDDGAVNAVLDWELSTVGDPLADFATALVYWIEPGDDLIPLDGAPAKADGFHSWELLCERYEHQSGREIVEFDYYVAFAYWRFAAILEGVYRRNLSGAYGERSGDADRFEWVVPALAERSIRHLEGGSTSSYRATPDLSAGGGRGSS